MSRSFLVCLGYPGQPFYTAQGNAMVAALQRLGFEALRVDTPHVNRVSMVSLRECVQKVKPTDVVTVNIPGAFYGGPICLDMMRWHTWVQDAYDANLEFPRKPCEIRWHWAKRWGDPLLLPATDYARFQAPEGPQAYIYDVAFCGFVPARLVVPEWPGAQELMDQVLAFWTAGAFDYGSELRNGAVIWQAAQAALGIRCPENYEAPMHHYIVSTLARYHQRIRMASALVEICGRRGWRLALAGFGWKHHFPQHAIGYQTPGLQLARLFQRSKVNLSVNGEVLFHGRVLEAFASGGFCLSVVSRDEWDAGLDLPKTRLENLEDRLEHWIASSGGRQSVTERISRRIEKEHTWDVRMAQLMEGGV